MAVWECVQHRVFPGPADGSVHERQLHRHDPSLTLFSLSATPTAIVQRMNPHANAYHGYCRLPNVVVTRLPAIGELILGRRPPFRRKVAIRKGKGSPVVVGHRESWKLTISSVVNLCPRWRPEATATTAATGEGTTQVQLLRVSLLLPLPLPLFLSPPLLSISILHLPLVRVEQHGFSPVLQLIVNDHQSHMPR